MKTDLTTFKPEDFLVWWFKNSDKNELKEEYNLLYSNYANQYKDLDHVMYHYGKRFENIIKTDLKGKKLLDVGCGLGTEIMWCSLQGADSTGLEMYSLNYDIACKRLNILKKD